MAQEKTGLHDLPVICTVPPSLGKEQAKAITDTRIRVLGVVLLTGLVIAGFLGVVYILSPSQSNGGSSLGGSYADDSTSNTDKQAVVEFDVDGRSHKEYVSVENDGKLVTIDDTDDGFVVTLDYDKGVAVVKNTSAHECYFMEIKNFPDYQTNDQDNPKPVMVERRDEAPTQDTDDMTPLSSLVKSDVIPWEFIKVSSDPSIADKCFDSTSYWLKEAPEKSVQKRQSNICVCWELWYIYSCDCYYFISWYCYC